jgi:malate/lactate dehydrogenase
VNGLPPSPLQDIAWGFFFILILFDVPMRTRGGKWEIVQGLPINDFSRLKIDASVAELKEEKSLVSELIG